MSLEHGENIIAKFYVELNMTNELYFSMILTLHSAEPEVGYQPEWFPAE